MKHDCMQILVKKSKLSILINESDNKLIYLS